MCRHTNHFITFGRVRLVPDVMISSFDHHVNLKLITDSFVTQKVHGGLGRR